MKNLTKQIINSIVFLLVANIGLSQSSNERIEKQIDSLFANYTSKTPGVAVAVVKDGKIIFRKGYGMATLEYEVPITSKTIFHIASVSKQFTAFSIYLLEKQGKISLEDDVRKYIPELPDYGKTIKIKHLLAHTSGLRDQFAMLTLAGWKMTDVMTTGQIMKLAIRQKNLNFEPGTELSYSNTGYTFLAEIVARISGKSFAEFTEENIFEPLLMSDTQFYDDYRKVVKNRAYSYDIYNDTYYKMKLNFAHVGATSLFTTVEDLAKWSNNFDNPIVGDRELITKFNEVSLLNNGKPVIWKTIGTDTLYHAKGQFLRDYRGVKILKHGGHDAGYRSFLARFPDENMAVITLSNDNQYEVFARGLDIAEFYLKDKLQPKEKITQNNNPQTEETSKPKTYVHTLKEFIGNYHSDEMDSHFEIVVKDDKLIMTHLRLNDIALMRTGENDFGGYNYFYNELEFIWKGKKIIGFEISNFGAKKVKFLKR